MSRRESKIVAIAGAVQAKSFDLTQYRQRSLVERRLKVRGEDAAGALAFASMDQYEGLDGKPTSASDPDGMRLPGDPLVTLLLRLKYADQWAKDSFQRAQLILLHRYGGLSGPPSETLFAIAYAALAEWLHDPCPKCRGQRAGVEQPAPCPACAPQGAEEMLVCNSSRRWSRVSVSVEGRRQTVEFNKPDGSRGQRVVASSSPRPGCPKCGGTGRLFREAKGRRGMQCVSCNNSGRVTLLPKRRWRMVSEYLVAAQRAREEPVRGLDYRPFSDHWHVRYLHFLDVLRAADRRLAAGLDLGIAAQARDAEEQPEGTP